MCGLILWPVKANPNLFNLVGLLLNQYYGSGMFIPNPNLNTNFSIPDPDPQQSMQVFFFKKIVTKILEILFDSSCLSRIWNFSIPDPRSATLFWIRTQINFILLFVFSTFMKDLTSFASLNIRTFHCFATLYDCSIGRICRSATVRKTNDQLILPKLQELLYSFREAVCLISCPH